MISEEIFMTEINASPLGNDAQRKTLKKTKALNALITGMLIPCLFAAAPLELAFSGRHTKTLAYEEFKAPAKTALYDVQSESSEEETENITMLSEPVSEVLDIAPSVPLAEEETEHQSLIFRYQQLNGEIVLISEKNTGSTDKPEPNFDPPKKATVKKAAAKKTQSSAKSAEVSISSSSVSVSGVPKAMSMTRLSGIEFDENGIPKKYKKVIEGKASAYTSYGNSRTATGTVPRLGTVAVNPKIIPYGTKMWIVSLDGSVNYGFAIAEDTGGFIKWKNPRIVDLFMPTKAQCRNWGVRGVRIYILE